MKEGTKVKIVYIDGQNKDRTEHYSKKYGEFLSKNGTFISLLIDGKEVMIPLSRVIRVEEEKEEKENKEWRY